MSLAYKTKPLKTLISSSKMKVELTKIFFLLTLSLFTKDSSYHSIILLGDLNYDMLDKSKSSKLNNVRDAFDLSNTVKEPTCFTLGNKPFLQ